jgi:uncharacterized Ntn-hydrolase superfamily protein
MTWSLIARDTDGALGVAIASRFFAVGALCPRVASGVGALATQALVNPLYAEPGLALLLQGTPPAEAIRVLTGPDPGRDHRQLHMIDAKGRSAAYTGRACIEWCGEQTGAGYSVAGNMLVGPQVLAETAAVYERASGRPFAERLLAALEAGDAAGGDKRGRQSAAIVIATTETYPSLSLRVDDHESPFTELRRLYDKSLERFQPFVACLPSRADPGGVVDRAVIEERVTRFQEERAKAKR